MFARRLLLTSAFVAAFAACSTPKPKPAAPPGGALNVVEHAADGAGDPEVTFHNVSDKPLAIDFDGPTKAHLEVPAAESRSIKLPAGTYTATVTGASLTSFTSTATFAGDHQYAISLRVVLELDVSQYAGKGFDCFEVLTGPRFFECARTAERCEVKRKKASEKNPKFTLGECSHHGALYHFRATVPAGVHAKFFTTEAACEAFRLKYKEHSPDETLTPCSKFE